MLAIILVQRSTKEALKEGHYIATPRRHIPLAWVFGCLFCGVTHAKETSRPVRLRGTDATETCLPGVVFLLPPRRG